MLNTQVQIFKCLGRCCHLQPSGATSGQQIQKQCQCEVDTGHNLLLQVHLSQKLHLGTQVKPFPLTFTTAM